MGVEQQHERVILDRLAAVSSDASNAAPPPVKFGITKMKGNALDFSFSGLKTAVLYHLREHPEYSAEIRARQAALDRGHKSFEHLLEFCKPQTLALIREFQKSVVRALVDRTLTAATDLSAPIHRQRRPHEFFPSRALSTDNAAMIAAAAYPRFRAGLFADTTLEPNPALALT